MLSETTMLFAPTLPCSSPVLLKDFAEVPKSKCLPHNTLEPVLEPLDGLTLVNAVGGADAGLGAPALGNALAWAGPVNMPSVLTYRLPHRVWMYSHAAVEVHAIDTDRRVVLDAQVDVLRDTEAEVAGLGEVALPQLVLLDLEATLEDLLCLGAADGDVDGDLLVTADTEGTDGVAGLACETSMSALCPFILLSPLSSLASTYRGFERRTVDWRLTAQLLEHLGGSRQSVTGLAHGDVQDQLLDAQLAHWIAALVFAAGLAIGLLR